MPVIFECTYTVRFSESLRSLRTGHRCLSGDSLLCTQHGYYESAPFSQRPDRSHGLHQRSSQQVAGFSGLRRGYFLSFHLFITEMAPELQICWHSIGLFSCQEEIVIVMFRHVLCDHWFGGVGCSCARISTAKLGALSSRSCMKSRHIGNSQALNHAQHRSLGCCGQGMRGSDHSF